MRWDEETPGMANSLMPKDNPRGMQPARSPILGDLLTRSHNLQGKSAPPNNETAAMEREGLQGVEKAR